MSFTYATLKTAIGDYLESAETTFTNNLPTFIQEAEDRILKFVELMTIAADLNVSAPSNT